ncbi:MAG: hypothetical protein Q9168_006368 [Polycauliona sp. 1 TL-2023]
MVRAKTHAPVLPAELRLQILESCPDVPTAASLARTSKSFYSTWEYIQQPLCEKLLKRSIDWYEDALYLFGIQPIPRNQKNLPSFKYQASKMIRNANVVENACQTIKTRSSDLQEWPSPTERLRFYRIYYLLWTLATASLDKDNLSSITTRIGLSKPQVRTSTRIIATTSRRYLDILRLLLSWMRRLVVYHCKNPTKPSAKDAWLVIWGHNASLYRKTGTAKVEEFAHDMEWSIRSTLDFGFARTKTSDAEYQDFKNSYRRIPDAIGGKLWRALQDDYQDLLGNE